MTKAALLLKPNPAVFSKAVLLELDAIVEIERARLKREPTILDPFAGVGLIHTLGTETVGVELEPEWANQHERTRVGDSRRLRRMFRRKFDLVVTSCSYGNRMADHHNAKDSCKICKGKGKIGRVICKMCEGKGLSKRNTYKHYLGRDLTPGNSGGMQWGETYRALHREVWTQIPYLVDPGGKFVLNISNHIRGGEEMPVAQWHRDFILGGPWALIEEIPVVTPRQRMGENGEKRAGNEWIFVFRRTA